MKNKLTRRSFLAASLAAGVAPTIIPAVAVRAQGASPTPSNRVTVGLIGCGNIANYHFNYLSRMEDVRIVAASDAYRGRREAMAARLDEKYAGKVCQAQDDFRGVFSRPDVDAVVLAVHDHWHVPMAIAAAEAGKDVYCQKPLGLDFGLRDRLRETFRRKKRVFQFGTQYRSMGRYRHMVQLVRNGYIGSLQRIDAWCRDLTHDVELYSGKPYGSTTEIPVPKDLNFDAWQGPSPMVPYTADRATCWGGYHCPETSLGFIAGCGIHELGLVQWANKSDDTSPVSYEGSGKVPQEGVFRTLESWDVTCDYANGVKLRFMDYRKAKTVAGPLLPSWHPNDGLIFYGSDGWISDAEGFCASDKTIWKRPSKPGDEALPPSDEHNRNFIDCVKTRQETICPLEMGIRCDVICQMANLAALTGRKIRWDPVQEKIVKDAEAEKLLVRSYRDTWKVW
jgi:predicted dehydrogenase